MQDSSHALSLPSSSRVPHFLCCPLPSIVCTNNYVKAADGECVECDGSVVLSFAFPAIVLLIFVSSGAYMVYNGGFQTIVEATDAAFEGAQGGDEQIIVDFAEGAKDAAEDLLMNRALETVEPSLLASAPQVPTSSDSADTDGTALATNPQQPSPPPSPPEGPPSSPATALQEPTASATATTTRAKPEHSLSFSATVSSVTAAAARCGLTQERVVSLQVKLRIIISFIQVLNSLGVVFSIPYPKFYDSLVAYLNVFSLDVFAVMPLGCTIDFNHDDYLLMRTLIPLGLLAISFRYRWRLMGLAQQARGGEQREGGAARDANESLADQLLTFNFILVYLLFPSTSANIFATFQCETLDDPAQSRFLRIDFSVDCDSAYHQSMMAFASIMVLVYPIGVPALYFYLLFYRHGPQLQLLRSLELRRAAIEKNDASATELSVLRDAEAAAKQSSLGKAIKLVYARVQRTFLRESGERSKRRRGSGRESSTDSRAQLQAMAESSLEAMRQIAALEAEEEKLRAALPDYVQKLILGYELRTYYFEIIESLRKLAIVCLPVFFRPSGSVSQLIFGLMVCFLTFGAHMLYHPYTNSEDDRLAQLCQVCANPNF